MNSTKSLFLKDFTPKPSLIVKSHEIIKAKFPVFDIHTHMGALIPGGDYENKYDTQEYIDTLRKLNITRINNLDGFWGKELDRIKSKTKGYETYISHFMWVDIERIDNLTFEKDTKKLIIESYQKGIKGIKMWKDISLYKKDKYGNPIRTDDPRLSVVYETAAMLNIPILIHIADPVAFFEPLDANNERYEELHENPEWSFSDKDKYMTFNQLLEMQESMIRNHPNTTFIVAHVGSYAENLKYVSNQLNQYPNMYIDIAARVAELGRVPYTSREFFIKHADRILFGSDCSPGNVEFIKNMFRFLETYDEYFPYEPSPIPGQGRWQIYGIGLPDDVLKKVYYENAERIFGK